MRLAKKLFYRSLLVLVGLCAGAVLVWRCATSPVLLHTHVLAKTDNQSCGPFNQIATGFTILNPFRSRAPERTADVFLRAASNGKCAPGLSEAACNFITTHPLVLPGTEWRLVYRWDSAERIDLFYRQERPRLDACRIFTVSLKRIGAGWEVFGFSS